MTKKDCLICGQGMSKRALSQPQSQKMLHTRAKLAASQMNLVYLKPPPPLPPRVGAHIDCRLLIEHCLLMPDSQPCFEGSDECHFCQLYREAVRQYGDQGEPVKGGGKPHHPFHTTHLHAQQGHSMAAASPSTSQ